MNAVGMQRAAPKGPWPPTPQLKATFLALSKHWEKLAIHLEDAFAKIAESEDIRSKVRASLDEAKRLSSLPIWKR
jgi:hypothetical protein